MFEWYMHSSVCYVYLFDVDVPAGQEELVSTEQLRKSRWASRGWTLQELIAPDTVRFFSSDWTDCGNRKDLALPLYQVTNIDPEILERLPQADERAWLYSLSVSKRMSWAATRRTTRPEDKAYCLLGLFNVNMAMLYGEGGPRAFHRLQEEIMKYSTDQTILAWSPTRQDWSKTMSVLADSPSAFHDGSRIQPIEQHEHFEMTSRGLRIAPRLYDSAIVHSDLDEVPSGTKVVLLSCVYVDDPHGQLGINVIQAEGEGSGSVFVRVMQPPVMIQVQHLREGGVTSTRDELLSEIGRRLPSNGVTPMGSDRNALRDYAALERQLVEQRFRKIQRYLQERDFDSIYIAHVTIRSQRGDAGDAFFFFPRITVSLLREEGIYFDADKLYARQFSLICPAVGTDAAELRSAKIGATQRQDIEVYLTELENIIGPNSSPCRVIVSRSKSDPSRLRVTEIQCQCSSECHLTEPTTVDYNQDPHVRCYGYGVEVTVYITDELLSGRSYNVVNFTVEVFDEPRQPTPPPKPRGKLLGKLCKLSLMSISCV
jgi:hypothetical protein